MLTKEIQFFSSFQVLKDTRGLNTQKFYNHLIYVFIKLQ